MLSGAGTSAVFKITDAKLYAPTVTVSTKGNVKLAKQFDD